MNYMDDKVTPTIDTLGKLCMELYDAAKKFDLIAAGIGLRCKHCGTVYINATSREGGPDAFRQEFITHETQCKVTK